MRELVLIFAMASASLTAAWAQAADPATPSNSPSSSSDPKVTAVAKRLDETIIPSIDFDKADIAAAIRFLNVEGKKYDPAHEGFHIRLDLPSGMSVIKYHREVTMHVENLPLSEILPYVVQKANLTYQIKADEIVVTTSP